MADETQENPESAEAAEAVPAAAPNAAAERILNQEEIDSLLGFDVKSDQLQD